MIPPICLENKKKTIIELKVNLQNPSTEILRENGTEDSETMEKLSYFIDNEHISPLPSRNKNKSIAFPTQLNLENQNKFCTPNKQQEKSQYFLKDSLTYPEKKRNFHPQYKSQNIPPFILNRTQNTFLKKETKNHNFSNFIYESDSHKSHNNLNTFRKSLSQEETFTNKHSTFLNKATEKYQSIGFRKAHSYFYESPDIKEFYKDIEFPKKQVKETNLLKDCKFNKVNPVYYLQSQINNHSKISLDKKFTKNQAFAKIEENFESDELSEGRSEDFYHFTQGILQYFLLFH